MHLIELSRAMCLALAAAGLICASCREHEHSIEVVRSIAGPMGMQPFRELRAEDPSEFRHRSPTITRKFSSTLYFGWPAAAVRLIVFSSAGGRKWLMQQLDDYHSCRDPGTEGTRT